MEFIKAAKSSILSIRGLRLQVRLGCEAEERQIAQFVRFDLRFRFPALPSACLTDRLEETICYAQASHLIQEVCGQGEYRLIEKLGWQAFQRLKESISPSVEIWLRVIKESPPVPGIQDGTSFTIGDWESNE